MTSFLYAGYLTWVAGAMFLTAAILVDNAEVKKSKLKSRLVVGMLCFSMLLGLVSNYFHPSCAVEYDGRSASSASCE